MGGTYNKNLTKTEIMRLAFDEDVDCLDICLQDQTTPPLDLYFSNRLGSSTTLQTSTNIDDFSINLTETSDFTEGDYVLVYDNVAQSKRFYFGSVLNVVSSTNTIELDTPLDFGFPSNSFVSANNINLAVNGSVTPQIFQIKAGLEDGDIFLDVVRFIFSLTSSSAMDDSRFGSLPALTKGIVLRYSNGLVKNIFNVKSNQDFINLSYDIAYSDKAPAGSNGLRVRTGYGGQSKHGVTIRLKPGDELQIIVQDDLTGLDTFKVMSQGHIVKV